MDDHREGSGGASVARFVALSFLLGITGFGGGYAVVQRVKHIVVEQKRWVSDHDFVEAFSVASALPGTAATNLLTILGLRLAGMRGAALSAFAFLLPSAALMVACAAFYDHIRNVTALSSIFDGMSCATVGIVAAVAVEMARSTVKTRVAGFIALAAVTTIALGAANLMEVVAVAALIGAIALRTKAPEATPPRSDVSDEPFPPSSMRSVPFAVLAATLTPSLVLFLVFARIGVATFGGGFAMIAPIEHEVVAARGWLTESAFNDAMVLGQITPGPVAIAATFIGYRVAALPGALAATLGMFLPPFALSVLAARSLAAFRANTVVQGILHGVAPAVVGVIAAAAISLLRTSVHSPLAGIIAGCAFVALVRFRKLSPLLPLGLGGAVNLVAHLWSSSPWH